MDAWKSDLERTLVARTSLRSRADELRKAAKASREAFRKDYMGVPSRWTADVYDRAAAVLESALDELLHAPNPTP